MKSLQKKNFTDKLANSCIYNLASKEFSERIDKKQVAQWIDVEFYMDPSMNKRAPSATCKNSAANWRPTFSPWNPSKKNLRRLSLRRLSPSASK